MALIKLIDESFLFTGNVSNQTATEMLYGNTVQQLNQYLYIGRDVYEDYLGRQNFNEFIIKINVRIEYYNHNPRLSFKIFQVSKFKGIFLIEDIQKLLKFLESN